MRGISGDHDVARRTGSVDLTIFPRVDVVPILRVERMSKQLSLRHVLLLVLLCGSCSESDYWPQLQQLCSLGSKFTHAIIIMSSTHSTSPEFWRICPLSPALFEKDQLELSVEKYTSQDNHECRTDRCAFWNMVTALALIPPCQ